VRVSVFGLGYVGAVTAACLARDAHEVVGVEPNVSKLHRLAEGRSPIAEPGLDELVGSVTAAGRLSVTSDARAALDGAQVSLVSVGTPSRPNGSLDLSFVESVCSDIGRLIADREDYHVVVIRSTMLPGSTTQVVIPALERASGRIAGKDFGVAVCPEFLRESSAIRDFYSPPFTILGSSDPRSLTMLRELFAFLRAPVREVDPGTAEALKYACNAFHAVKVTFANEIARFCSASDVDPRQVMDVFVEDQELNISSRYLRPGFAFGGSCLPKDIRALTHRARTQDVNLPMLSALLPSNRVHIDQAVSMVLETGARRVALMGLSFKPGTDDLRESPFVALAEKLIGKGIDLKIYDELVNPERLLGANRAYFETHLPHLMRGLADTAEEALDEARCVVLATTDPVVMDALLLGPAVPVIDLSGGLSHELEINLADRSPIAVGEVPPFQGLAW